MAGKWQSERLLRALKHHWLRSVEDIPDNELAIAATKGAGKTPHFAVNGPYCMDTAGRTFCCLRGLLSQKVLREMAEIFMKSVQLEDFTILAFKTEKSHTVREIP